MRVKVELSNNDVKALIIRDLSDKIGLNFKLDNVSIKVRSRQNYREKEWESGEFLVTYEGEI